MDGGEGWGGEGKGVVEEEEDKIDDKRGMLYVNRTVVFVFCLWHEV